MITGYSELNNPLLKIKPTSTRGDNSDIFKVYSTDGESKFWITNEGDISTRAGWLPRSDRQITAKQYVDNAIKADKKPAGFEFRYAALSDSKDKEEAKSLARIDGQYVYYGANSEYYLYINRFDYHKHVNISPYYEEPTSFTASNDEVEDLSIPPEAVTTAEGEHLIDYQGLGMRQFLSVYRMVNGQYRLGRIYYITGVTFYKNEPFIRADVSTWKSLDKIYYGLNHLHVPGII